MKTLSRILFLAIFSVALTSCSDNGPTSVSDKDARTVQSSVLPGTANAGHDAPVYSVPINPAHLGAENPGFSVPPGVCPTPPEGQEGWWGWHFVMPGQSDFAALSVTFEYAGNFYANPFPGDVFVAYPHAQHAYIWTPTPDKLIAATAEATGSPPNQFVLSHVCDGDYGESLEVTKTVVTYFERTHDWSIDKWVGTDNELELDDVAKIWLYTDGSGDENAEWTVEVTYEGYEDSDWNVSGEITIENIGIGAKLIDSVVDELDGTVIEIECKVDEDVITFPYSLAEGATITCTYSEDVDGEIEGYNVVTVTVDEEENDPNSPYSATEPIVWGDPDEEFNKVVDVVDISDLYDLPVTLGTLDAENYEEGDKIPFTYDEDFAWADYGADRCGSFRYDNTAEVRGDDEVVLDSADASLKVNVQCFLYETESAWAKGDPNESFCGNGFNNWGWTNLFEEGDSQFMPLYAGAGQCDISKGTLVGTVEISYNGDFSYEYHLDPGFSLKEYHIYAGSTMFPQQLRGRNQMVDTVAPGQYYIADPLEGDIWVIAHGVVQLPGIPDPDFGPQD